MTLQNKSKKVGDVIVSIWSTEEQGLSVEEGGKWVIICETHGGIIQGTNFARLWSHANQVGEWCEACQQVKAVA